MDPATAAGLGLAVVGLAGQCFAGAMKAFQLIAAARGLQPEYRYLTLRLQLEQQRYYNWASACGLLSFLSGDGDALGESLIGLNRTRIFEIMVEIEILATGFIKQQDRYGRLVAAAEEHNPSHLAGDQEEFREGGNSLMPELKQLWKNTRQSVASAQLPKRLRWATVDRENYQGLVSRLKDLNDGLLNLVDGRLNQAICETTHETKLSVLQLHNKIDDLNQLVKALLPNTGTLDYGSDHTFPSTVAGSNQLSLAHLIKRPSQTERTLRKKDTDDDLLIADLARFKVSNAMITNDQVLDKRLAQDLNIGNVQSRFEAIKIPRARVHLSQASTEEDSRRQRSVGTYQLEEAKPVPIWIEWKPYIPFHSRSRPSPAITERVQKLAVLLANPHKPKSLRVSTCLGYFDDGERVLPSASADPDEEDDRPPVWRFGFVYKRSDFHRIVSLHDMLAESPQPSLTRRVDLAAKIATSVLSLHAVNWLHKSLRSSNILFLIPPNHDSINHLDVRANIDLESPLLAGFNYARPASSDETEPPTIRRDHVFYRHPDSHGVEEDSGERYIKTFDIYSLGVMLAEIALWRPASSFISREKVSSSVLSDKPHTRVYKNNRDKMLNDSSIRDALEGNAGARYAATVRICLQGKSALGLSADDDESEALVGVKLQNSFYREVVRRLREIQI